MNRFAIAECVMYRRRPHWAPGSIGKDIQGGPKYFIEPKASKVIGAPTWSLIYQNVPEITVLSVHLSFYLYDRIEKWLLVPLYVHSVLLYLVLSRAVFALKLNFFLAILQLRGKINKISTQLFILCQTHETNVCSAEKSKRVSKQLITAISFDAYRADD